MIASRNDPRGSTWRRWDPHIHTPGTVLNNQYTEPDAWEQFLVRIECATPVIEALGITDYGSIDRYEQALEYKAAGRLADVGLLFPNIELRFGIGTHRGSAINIHLLVSPEHQDHMALTRKFLEMLIFGVAGETYRCRRDDLVALGKAHDASVIDDDAAFAVGTNQFKITPETLRRELARNQWARDNILIGVAGGNNDGTSGLQTDASLAAVRREIERMARIIFSSQPAQREFWLGQKSQDVESLRATWGGRKVCLHGSDAHQLTDVGAPDLDRFTWIKGDPTFDSLRQACIEPGSRAMIAPQPPTGPLAYRTINTIEIEGTPWCSPKRIPLNDGLVGIIGARGSGKTSLDE